MSTDGERTVISMSVPMSPILQEGNFEVSFRAVHLMRSVHHASSLRDVLRKGPPEEGDRRSVAVRALQGSLVRPRIGGCNVPTVGSVVTGERVRGIVMGSAFLQAECWKSECPLSR